MESRCLGRRTNERLLFGDGKHYFYTEERCKRTTKSGLCTVCEGSKNLDEHGIVSEDIPPLSHIYGSDWYNLKRGVYGNPSDINMAKAKKAQEEARSDLTTTTTTTTKEKKKRTFKVAAPAPVSAEEPAPVQPAAEQPIATPVKAKRQPKKVTQVQAPPQQIQPLATESVEPPLEDIPCIIITVRKIEHNGRNYYLNSAKDKLYTVLPDGGVGKYCGRLDKDNERLADFPDSDSER
jgi:hypothetical protein